MLHILSMVYFAGLLFLCVALLGALLRNESARIAEVLGLSARTTLPALPPRRREGRAAARVTPRRVSMQRAAA